MRLEYDQSRKQLAVLPETKIKDSMYADIKEQITSESRRIGQRAETLKTIDDFNISCDYYLLYDRQCELICIAADTTMYIDKGNMLGGFCKEDSDDFEIILDLIAGRDTGTDDYPGLKMIYWGLETINGMPALVFCHD